MFLLIWSSVGPAASATSGPKDKAATISLIGDGIRAYNNEDYPTAIDDLGQAQTLAPDSSAAALYLGLAYLKKGDLSKAIVAWQKYITLEPQTEVEKTSNLQETVARDLGILMREENHRQAQDQIAHESQIGTPDPNAIAVSYYRNLGSPELAPLQKGLTALVIADVSKVPGLKVVERDKLQALLDEMKLGSSGIADQKSAARAGHLLGASRVVTGSYVDPAKGQLQINSVLAQSGSAQATGSQNVSGSTEHFYDVEKQLSAAILKDLGYSEDRLKAEGVWQQVQTPQTTNYPAFVAFSRGLDAKDRQDYPQARALFQQALLYDPAFALALQELNRTPVQVMSVGEVASSVGAQAPGAAAVLASISGAQSVSASVPNLPTIGAISAPPPPPPPAAPPPLPSLPSFPSKP